MYRLVLRNPVQFFKALSSHTAHFVFPLPREVGDSEWFVTYYSISTSSSSTAYSFRAIGRLQHEKKNFNRCFWRKVGNCRKLLQTTKTNFLVVVPHILLYHPNEEQQLWKSRSKHSMVPTGPQKRNYTGFLEFESRCLAYVHKIGISTQKEFQ